MVLQKNLMVFTMKNGKGIIALSVISLLIGASGLGIGLFSYINFETVQGPQGLPGEDGDDGIDGTLDNLVAVWDTVTGSGGTDFNLTLLAITFNRSEYFELTDTYRKITLIEEGWYRFSLKCLFTNINPGNNYSCSLYRNNERIERFWFSQTPTGTSYHMCSGIVYAYSFPYEYFNIRAEGGAFFSILGQAEYNQLVLEYVGEV